MAEKGGIYDNSDVLVVGTGYLGKRVARICRAAGARVFTTTRRPDRFPELSESGYHPVRLDWTDRRTLENLRRDDLSAKMRVLVAISYDSRGRLGRYQSQVGGLENLLGVLPGDSRLCYISTTGVYHQIDGRWVDETSPTNPNRIGGRVHLQAEQVLHRLRPKSAYLVLRLAGIYGPGRVPRIADVIKGQPIASPPEGYLNLIHVDDAVRAVVQSWDLMQQRENWQPSMQSRLFCVADDLPVVRGDFYREIARQCNAREPNFIVPEKDAPVKMRSISNKRVCNRKMKRDLLPRLMYPDYRAGLVDVLANSGSAL